MRFRGRSRRRPPQRRGAFLFSLSRAYTDVVLLAQLLGAAANFIWYSEISTSDLVGFIYLGGDIAGLFAYFGFILFAMFYFWLAPRRFWQSLHPVTLGLALALLSSHRLWNANTLLIAIAACIGGLIGRFTCRYVLLYPRAALILSAIIIPIARRAMPREVAPYAIVCIGTLLIFIVCTPVLMGWRRRRVEGI